MDKVLVVLKSNEMYEAIDVSIFQTGYGTVVKFVNTLKNGRETVINIKQIKKIIPVPVSWRINGDEKTAELSLKLA